jgi:hypothetical protein
MTERKDLPETIGAMTLLQIFPEAAAPLVFALPHNRGERAVLGVDPTVAMVIPGDAAGQVARRQCLFVVKDELIVMDSNSGVPTYLNGEPLVMSAIRAGDRLRIADVYEFAVVESAELQQSNR